MMQTLGFLLVLLIYWVPSIGKQCKLDEDCGASHFCYDTGQCAQCTDCSRYYQEENGNCAKDRTECGNCIAGYMLDPSNEYVGNMKRTCISLEDSQLKNDNYKSITDIYWVLVAFAILILTLISCSSIWYIVKRCKNRTNTREILHANNGASRNNLIQSTPIAENRNSKMIERGLIDRGGGVPATNFPKRCEAKQKSIMYRNPEYERDIENPEGLEQLLGDNQDAAVPQLQPPAERRLSPLPATIYSSSDSEETDSFHTAYTQSAPTNSTHTRPTSYPHSEFGSESYPRREGQLNQEKRNFITINIANNVENANWNQNSIQIQNDVQFSRTSS